MSSAWDVIIVGGGPAGASLAWRLATRGVSTLVIDRAEFPRAKPCAEYVSPEASRILDEMRVLDSAIDAGAARLTGMQVRAPNGATLVGEFARAREFRGAWESGIALRRERLDALLLGAARDAGAGVRERAQVSGLVHARDAVAGVVLTSGETLPARLVVGADGLRSVVARRLGLGAPLRWPRRVAFVTHYRGVLGMGAHGEMHVEPDGYVGLAPVDGGLVNVAVVVPVQYAHAAAGDAAGFVDAWLRRRAHLWPRFAHAARVTPVRGVGPFGWRTRRATAPGAALVGDAADFLDPFTGEGIYAALRGAELLAPLACNALGATHPALAARALRDYDRARRAEFSGKWTVERLVAAAVAFPAVMNRVARGLARRRDLADTLVGVTGDVVPARAVLRPGYALALTHAAFS